MILRKPYAFLIKHFKIINLILFVLVAFSINNLLKVYSFIKDYLATGIYNITLTPITNYINAYTYLVMVAVLIISAILFYLLRRKDKPFITYIYVILLMIANIVLFVFTNNFFSEIKEFNSQMTLLYRDFSLIVSFFYYPVLLILAIRFLGIDLNSFGFYQDKQFIEADEEDNEEVEVDVAFDKARYLRIIKNKIRYTKYFILEHKKVLFGVLVVIILFGAFNFYNYIYVENRIYKQNEAFISNNFEIKINNSYLTDKDYAGNVISTKNRYYIVLDVDIKSLYSSRTFDFEKLMLYIDDKFYVPTVRFNSSFVDMGTLYKKDMMFPYNEVKNVLFVYEVDKPGENPNFLLKYQDLNYEDSKLIRVKLRILDISSFKEKDKADVKNELTVPLNLGDKYAFTVSNFEITNEKNYTYESCYLYNCPIYEKTLISSSDKTLLFLKVDTNKSITDFITFMKRYGKVRYVVDGKEYTEKVSLKITKYRGNYAYIEVDDNIKNASKVELVFTVRTYQYFYKLKG